jgi:hypothetical protein
LERQDTGFSWWLAEPRTGGNPKDAAGLMLIDQALP